jgi:hypothetical protein
MKNKLDSTQTKLQKTQNGQNGVEKPKPMEAEVRAAFRFVYDTLEGLMLIGHYTLLGDAARAVKLGDYTPIGRIEVGLQTNRLTPEVKQALKEWRYVETENGWEQLFMNVLIIFKEVKRKYEFFQQPDTQYFDVDEYRIPNPFDKYWKARFLVQ